VKPVTAFQKLKLFIGHVLHFGGYSCFDTEHLLFEYVEEELPADVRAKLDKHIADCPPCIEYVNGYRRTIQAMRQHALPPTEMPDELRRRLAEFLEQNPRLR
jgi:anti-sigma factor RsiW